MKTDANECLNPLTGFSDIANPGRTTKKQYSIIYVIGCGGVGGHLLPTLLRTVGRSIDVVIMDGDTVEAHNLDRQLFRVEQIGMYKTEALVENLVLPPGVHLEYLDRYFTSGTEVEPGALIFACVDNHAARRYILAAADRAGADVIVCANDYDDAQAYYYTPAWKDMQHDPRVRFSDILSDDNGDPTNISCTGIAQERSPQLAIYNMIAAAMGLHLFWLVTRYNIQPENMAYQHFCNFNRFRSDILGQPEGV